MSQLLVVLGTTAVGKTHWLVKNFQNRNYCVVNIDSIQIYKHFDIGSAKISLYEQSLLPHYMIDQRDPLEPIDVKEYCLQSQGCIKDLLGSGKKVIVSGGTPFYIKSLLWGFPSSPKVSQEVRSFVKNFLRIKGVDYCLNLLKEIDLDSFYRIHRNDIYRLSRALEIWFQTNKPPSSFNSRDNIMPYSYDVIGLFRPKLIMWQRAFERVNLMKSLGLEDEVKNLVKKGYKQSLAMQAIGYKEWFQGEYSTQKVYETIYYHTRQYIKKQTTFFKSFQNVEWFDLENNEDKLNQYLQELAF